MSSKKVQKALPAGLKFLDVLAVVILLLFASITFLIKNKNVVATTMPSLFGYKYACVVSSSTSEYENETLLIAKNEYSYNVNDTIAFIYNDAGTNFVLGKSFTVGKVLEVKDVNNYRVKFIDNDTEVNIPKAAIEGKIMYKNLLLGKIHNLMTGSNGVILFVVPPLAIVLLLLIISIVTANSRKNRMKRYAADSGYDFDNSIIEDTAVSYEQMNKQDSLKGSFNVFKQAEITKKDDEIQYAFKDGIMQDNETQTPQNNDVMPLNNQPTPPPPMQNRGQGFNPMGMSAQQNQTMGNNFNGNQPNNGFVPLNAQRPMPQQMQNSGQGFNPMGMSAQQNQTMGSNFNGNQPNNGFVPLNAQRPMPQQMQNGGMGFNPIGMSADQNNGENSGFIDNQNDRMSGIRSQDEINNYNKNFEDNIDKLNVEEEDIDLVQENSSDIGLVEQDEEDRVYDYTPDVEADNENYEDYQELNRIPTVNELFGKKQETEKIEEKTESEEQPILNANFKDVDISSIIEQKSKKENITFEKNISKQDNLDEPENAIENSKIANDEQEDNEECEQEQKEKDINDLKEFLKTL